MEIEHGEYNLRIFGGLVFEFIYFTQRTEHFFVLWGKGIGESAVRETVSFNNIFNKRRLTVLFSFPYSLNLLWPVFGCNLETLKTDVLFNFVSLRVSFLIT